MDELEKIRELVKLRQRFGQAAAENSEKPFFIRLTSAEIFLLSQLLSLAVDHPNFQDLNPQAATVAETIQDWIDEMWELMGLSAEQIERFRKLQEES